MYIYGILYLTGIVPVGRNTGKALESTDEYTFCILF